VARGAKHPWSPSLTAEFHFFFKKKRISRKTAVLLKGGKPRKKMLKGGKAQTGESIVQKLYNRKHRETKRTIGIGFVNYRKVKSFDI